MSGQTVTAISPSPRRPGRVEITAGNAEWTVSLDDLGGLDVRVGAVVDDALRVRLDDAALRTRVYDRAAGMLAARGRASAELRRLLVQKGEDPVAVDAAIERLREQGFLDDEAFARQFARSRVAGRGMARRRVADELRRRGVDRQVAGDAIEAVFQEEAVDERSALADVAERRLRLMARLDVATQRRRLFAYLSRRGYDSEDIRAVISRLVGQGRESDD
jgi:regulatory protein